MQACATWVKEFRRPPDQLHLVALSPELREQLTRHDGMPVSELPEPLRKLAPHCPAALPIAITVVKEGLGAATEGTKLGLPVQLLTGVGEIVANKDDNEAEICRFLITQLAQ